MLRFAKIDYSKNRSWLSHLRCIDQVLKINCFEDRQRMKTSLMHVDGTPGFPRWISFCPLSSGSVPAGWNSRTKQGRRAALVALSTLSSASVAPYRIFVMVRMRWRRGRVRGRVLQIGERFMFEAFKGGVGIKHNFWLFVLCIVCPCCHWNPWRRLIAGLVFLLSAICYHLLSSWMPIQLYIFGTPPHVWATPPNGTWSHVPKGQSNRGHRTCMSSASYTCVTRPSYLRRAITILYLSLVVPHLLRSIF